MKFMMDVSRSRVCAWSALVLAIFENLFYGTVILGWPSLAFILKKNGYFSNLCAPGGSSDISNCSAPDHSEFNTSAHNISDCPNMTYTGFVDNSSSPCAAQDARLQLAFAISSSINSLSMLPVGLILDRLGTRMTRVIMSLSLFIGHLFMGFSSRDRPYLIFPGTIFFTVGGVMVLFSTMQIGNVFEQQRSTVITLLIGCYGASTLLFYIVSITFESGFSMNASFFILAGSVVFLSINTILLPKDKIVCPPRPENNIQRITVFTVSANTGSEVTLEDMPTGDAADNATMKLGYPSVLACIKSSPFWLTFMWFSILQFDVTFTFGIINHILTSRTNDEELIGSYTNVFSIIQSLILFFGPIGGLLMDKCRGRGKSSSHEISLKDSSLPLALAIVWSIGYSVCLLLPSLTLQYLTFVLIMLLRSMLFGVASAVCAIAFPQHFATVYGAIRTLGGIVLILQYPLFLIVQRHLNGNPFYVTVGFIAAKVGAFLVPVYFYFTSKRTSEANT